MRIARVFPTKTSMCPDDHLSFTYDEEPRDFFRPFYDEVHISCQFTWDIPKAKKLVEKWSDGIHKVRLGGVAIDGESDKPFQAGMYLKKGITITSRGCPNNCNFCIVRRGLIEFNEFPEGNIVQDNNILACSDHHWQLVMKMLKKQRAIEFRGGLEKYRITPKIAEDLRGLRIKTLWISCDQPEAIKPLQKAVEILQKAGFTRNHLYCYVLIGDNKEENENRLKEVFKMGVMPFAQLYKDKTNSTKYTKEWKNLARTWSRPAAYKTLMNFNSLKG